MIPKSGSQNMRSEVPAGASGGINSRVRNDLISGEQWRTGTTMIDEDDVTTFRLHLEMHFCNFAVLTVLCMKPSALERKRCAELFATFLAQIEPRNVENSP